MRSDFSAPGVLIKITDNGQRAKGDVHADRYAVTLVARRPLCENLHPMNDWGVVPIGDKPEITKSSNRYMDFGVRGGIINTRSDLETRASVS